MPLSGDAGFPAGGALAEQVAVGSGELVADLRGAVKLIGRGSAEGAKAGSRDSPMLAQLARDSEARIEDALAELRGLAGSGRPDRTIQPAAGHRSSGTSRGGRRRSRSRLCVPTFPQRSQRSRAGDRVDW